LPWLIAQPQINAIAGARYPQQALDNALAAHIKLYPTQLVKIDAIGRILSNRLDES
jgi:myo-inositol catabolism protein IolS